MDKIYRTATVKDALYVAKNLTEADLTEIQGLGQNPGCVIWSVVNSTHCISFAHPDRPEEIMGVAGVVPDERPGVGVVWALTTPHITDMPFTVVRQCKQWLAEIEGYSMLWNLADARNTFHHKMLRLLGFKAIATRYPAPYYLPYLEIIKLCAPQSP